MQLEGLDELDNNILEAIEKNARLTYSEIAARVGVSRVSVKARMEAMEAKGIIKGYHTIINPTGLPDGRKFILEVFTEPDQFEQVVERISTNHIIRKVYSLTGSSHFIAEGYAISNTRYEIFMKELKRNSQGIKSLAVQDVQYTIKDLDGGVRYETLYEREKRESASALGGEHFGKDRTI